MWRCSERGRRIDDALCSGGDTEERGLLTLILLVPSIVSPMSYIKREKVSNFIFAQEDSASCRERIEYFACSTNSRCYDD